MAAIRRLNTGPPPPPAAVAKGSTATTDSDSDTDATSASSGAVVDDDALADVQPHTVWAMDPAGPPAGVCTPGRGGAAAASSGAASAGIHTPKTPRLGDSGLGSMGSTRWPSREPSQAAADDDSSDADDERDEFDQADDVDTPVRTTGPMLPPDLPRSASNSPALAGDRDLDDGRSGNGNNGGGTAPALLWPLQSSTPRSSSSSAPGSARLSGAGPARSLEASPVFSLGRSPGSPLAQSGDGRHYRRSEPIAIAGPHNSNSGADGDGLPQSPSSAGSTGSRRRSTFLCEPPGGGP